MARLSAPQQSILITLLVFGAVANLDKSGTGLTVQELQAEG
jgi:hypothetical protein